MDRDRFCQCPCCDTWFSIHDILESPEVEPLGMAFDECNKDFNLLYFNHLGPRCGSTFTVEARRFEPFLSEMAPPEVMAGRPDCEHHCTSMDNLAECRSECRWAPYRRFMVRLRARRNLPAR